MMRGRKALVLGQTILVFKNNHSLGQEGTEMLNQMLETNESLISLDLRDNPGFTLPFSKNIFDKLVRNIRLFKEGKMNEEGYDQEVSNGYH